MALRVMHQIPGRLRVQSAVLRQRTNVLLRIENEVSTLKGVAAVRTNAVTGSVVIEYDSRHCGNDVVLQRIAKASGLAVEIPALNGGPTEPQLGSGGMPYLAEAIQEPVQLVDRGLFRLTRGYMDLRYAAPMALAMYGTFKLIREGPVPAIPWYLLYWWSFRMFVILNRQSADPVV